MRRRLPLILPLLVLILGVALRNWDPGALRDIRYRTFDLLQQLNPRPYDPTLPVRIVVLDELSLSRYGQWPWPRTLMAELTDKLREAGVKAIAFDVLFAEPDRSSPQALLEQLPPGAARDALEKSLRDGSLIDNDEVFARALAKAPSVLAFAFANESNGAELPLPKGGVSFKGSSPLPYVYRFPGALMPLRQLADAAPGLGTIRVLKDSDGTQRRVMLVAAISETTYPGLEVTQRIYPSLALEALRLAAGGANILMKAADSAESSTSGSLGVQAIRVGKGKGYIIETQPQGEIWLWDSGSQRERYVSASAVLDGTADLEKLKGNIVFFGTTAAGLYDNLPTPLSPAMPGVELHAQITEQMLTGTFLSRPWWADAVEKLAVALVGLLIWLCFAIRRVGAVWAAVLGGVLVSAGFATAWYAFTVEHFLLDPITPSAIGLMVYATAGIAGYLTSERQRREVRAAFGQYVSPDVVARIANNPTKVKLGGEARELTLLFCDVRGFTTLSERLTPEALTRLINRFLTEMSDAILASNGTIDKYMGDCVMGFWNAPLDVPDHAARACAAILDMRQRLVRLNEALSAEGDSGLRLGVGIGVNSGNCSVGNMGSAQRLAYTAVGDNVNLAARLEGLTRLYGLDCLVSEATTLGALDYTFLEVDSIRVKGRVQPVTVYALLGRSADLGQEALAQVLGVKAFLQAFRAGDWAGAEAALAALQPLLQAGPLAGLLPRYRERLDDVKDRPAPEGWDGVYTAREK